MGKRVTKVKNLSVGTLAVCLFSVFTIGIEDVAAATKKIKNKDDMAFGSVAGDADLGGTVVESTASAKTVTGGVADFGGVDLAAKFEVQSNTAGESITCSLPGSIQVTSGANSATVDSFTTDPLLSGLMPSGEDKVNVLIGATVHLAAGQAAGNYTGTFTLTCDSKTKDADVTITIGAPISISNTASLEFGQIVTGTGVSVVRITPAGVRSLVSGDAALAGGTSRAATFDITGEASGTYAITLPSSATLSGPGADMTVDTFVHDAGGSPALAAGSDTFNVGADLHVGASQAGGAYSDTFSVTVNWN